MARKTRDGTVATWGAIPLPVSELLHPAAVVAMITLGVNDHLLKGSGLLPGWLTGKLSDLSGMIFFPLLLTALTDTALFAASLVLAAFGRDAGLDFRLRKWKLAVACALTGAVFAAIKVSHAAAGACVDALGALGFPSHAWCDPTDLTALALLPVSFLIGASRIERQIP
ncbi:MAG: hypothetical protein PHU25_00675 [Deltaproteobacteria bacterium]|nr:hypothetical protein [Deltaproteobacteria bacterium]